MEKFWKIIENTTWYRQLVYGSILGAFFMVLCLLGHTTTFLALIAVAVIAAAKEHCVEHLKGEFNYRNFMLLILPVLLAHIVMHW